MNSQDKIPVLILFGQTAIGKTDLLSELFSSDGGSGSCLAGTAEIVNADSVQVYKRMSICAAAPPQSVKQSLPHHLVEIIEPGKEFSAADFVKEADILCRGIYGKNKLPVLSGGTAFFLKNFIYGLPVTPAAKAETRKFFQNKIKTEGAQSLLDELHKFDPVTAKKLHVNDEYRIIRAHEVYADSGKPLSYFTSPSEPRSGYVFRIIALERPRDVLYKRIDMRIEKMFEQGLYEEFKALYEKGYRRETPGLKAIGCREFFEVNPENPLTADIETVKALIKRNTKKYAKRQETFFKKIENVERINLEDSMAKTILLNSVSDFYKKNIR